MMQQISIILDYDEYIDIRFLSYFLYHLKASATYIYKHRNEYHIKELINLIDKTIVDFNKRRVLKLDEILSYLSDNTNFEKMYNDYISARNKYNFFISENVNIKILTIEKGSVEIVSAIYFLIKRKIEKESVKSVLIGLSLLILASATAYKITKAKEVYFEIPKVVKIKIRDE